MTIVLQGILGPVVTPFLANGDVDSAGFGDNVRAHIAAGLNGILVAGSTGEAALLDESERRSLLEVAREAVPSDRLLLAGTGAESTRECLRLTRQAAECGADAVLIVPPHYYAPAMTASALHAHYTRIADESPVPVLLYNIPKYTHFSLAPTLVLELAMHPNVIGMKDSSGDLDLLTVYVNAQSSSFTVLTGHASTLHRAFQSGVRGGILAAALFAPGIAIAIQEAVRSGDKAAGDVLQRRLIPLGKTIVAELGVAGVKSALDQIGLVGGPVRAPLLPVSDGDAARITQLLREADVLQPA